jgi:hypothetical protein
MIKDFISSFNMYEVARPNRFSVTINGPTQLQQQNIFRQLTLRCETAELPGRTFGTVDQKTSANPTTKSPIHTSYNDLSLTFIVSGDMSEKHLFDQWMELINPQNTYDFAYKNDYVGQITITQYSLENYAVASISVYNAYPIVVNQMDLDWSADGHHKLTVVFAFDEWINNDITSLNSDNANALSQARGLGGRPTNIQPQVDGSDSRFIRQGTNPGNPNPPLNFNAPGTFG